MGALNIFAIWSAKVANRKIARQVGTPLNGTASVVSAAASSDANGGQLTGSMPGFAEGAAIPLGQITPTGIFVPPKSGVFRKTAGDDVPGFPGSDTVIDNTCDGTVTVRLIQGGQVVKDVLPACIVVCAHDFSPDVDPNRTLVDYLKETLQIPTAAPPGNLHNQAARALDEASLEPGTAIFSPGIEVSFSENTEVVDVKGIFYQNSQDPRIDPREMRIRYKSAPTDQGAVPGQLTSGLCSPWQSDYTACVGFWPDHLPREAFLNENSSTIVEVFRKQFADTSSTAETLSTGNDFLQVDQIGVVRLRNGKTTETERNGDIGEGVA
jgi:hypothetical protein